MRLSQSSSSIYWSLPHRYEYKRELGKGSSAHVCLAIDKLTGNTVAIKKYGRASDDQNHAKNCLRELEILKKLNHRNIVRPYEIFPSATKFGGTICVSLEYFPMNFLDLLRSSMTLELIQLKKIMYELLIGLNYLHSAGIVHRDIKPGNLLLNEQCEVKICDFDLARSIDSIKLIPFEGSEKGANSSYEETDLIEEDEIPCEIECSEEINKPIAIPGRFNVEIGKMEIKADVPYYKPFYTPKKIPIALHRSTQKTSSFARCQSQKCTFPVRRSQGDIKIPLTSHVTTRWYRAPEVILLCKTYDSSVDIWGAGCVFAELMQMLKGNETNNGHRKPLFPGTSCYPLSPSNKMEGEVIIEEISPGDQLEMICKLLGTPSNQDVSFLSAKRVKDYIRLLPNYKGEDLNTLYPASPKDALDLLKKMITFNPNQRISANEALEHPFFAEIRDKRKECQTEKITLDYEKTTDYIKELAEMGS